jgi:hypothetical protein
MKLISTLAVMLITSVCAIAQPSVPFACPGAQVIAYKSGTNCTASAYNFYSIDFAGVQSATPFYTLSNTSKEVNGIGINPVDGYLYGIEYDRTTVGSSCAFSNLHLFRYDAIGNKADLGVLPAPAGGVASSAMGCVSLQGHYTYSATDAAGVRYIAQVNNVSTLPSSVSTLTAKFKALTTVGTAASYADWAISPVNGKMYSYGIYNTGGISTGTVIEIDPVAGTVTTVGAPNYTSFTDITRDNFGGIYFLPNGYLYGVNINTRRLYRIDVSSGAITHVSTMAGPTQIRADMGSCTTGSLTLAVHFVSTGLQAKGEKVLLKWEVGESEKINSFVIEQQRNNRFETVAMVNAIAGQSAYSYDLLSSGSTVYRIKAVLNNSSVLYSKNLYVGKPGFSTLAIVSNPVLNGVLELNQSNATGESYSIVNISGNIVKRGVLNSPTVEIHSLQAGMYFMRVGNGSGTAMKFVIR